MKLTVVMPYWERLAAARKTLKTYDALYGDDVKVIIVDDGSPNQPAKPLEDEFERVTVIELPIKHEVKNPCLPINIGVSKATTEYIGLSNPETFHTEKSLYEMLSLIENDNDYVLAPAWCPEHGQWHCHPDLKSNDLPEGTGLHHMAVMKKVLWDKTGGMDEEYRDGYCFDDTDYVMRLVKTGANFIYSTLPVFHSRSGAKAFKDQNSWHRNQQLFLKKWSFA